MKRAKSANKKAYSWGGLPRVHQRFTSAAWQDEVPSVLKRIHQHDRSPSSILAYGNGRSYGDSCLNSDGICLKMGQINRLISFNAKTGLLTCEAGITLHALLTWLVPQGWFLPVTPGTQFITVGGAIANDVHGKNHHQLGSFGCHIQAVGLVRENGTYTCSRKENSALFAATIGGLGLTGIITWATLQLIKIPSPWLCTETLKMPNLEAFFEYSHASMTHEYTVAWVDSQAKGKALGRGHFIRGNFAPLPTITPHAQVFQGKLPKARRYSIPTYAPSFTLNNSTVRCFNELYYHRQLRERQLAHTHYQSFFYPLDAIGHWNRIYGRRGFYQYQCVVPKDFDVVKRILETIANSGLSSFLTVLKVFGEKCSPGLLSFPRPGITYALDFPNIGPPIHSLFDQLDNIVLKAGGALYPAKDARMSSDAFIASFPKLNDFLPWKDAACNSDFWRRVQPNT